MANYDNTSLIEILDDKKTQFVIPFYQRGYNWKTEQIKKLIDDLVDFTETNTDMNSKYYVGNIVTKQLKITPGQLLRKNVIVDGQQRITSTLLIVMALKNINSETFDDMDRYIKLKNSDETRMKIDRLNDGHVLHKIMENTTLTDDEENTNMYKNYTFAKKYIKNNDISEKLFQGLESTLLLNVVLSETENENKVFETINSSGMVLRESDLIKNFVFFFVHLDNFAEKETELMNKFTETIEKEIADEKNDKRLNEFYRYFIAANSKTKKLVSLTKQNAIYNAFKEVVLEMELDMSIPEDVEALLDKMSWFSKMWMLIDSEKLRTNMTNKFYLNVFKKNRKTYFMLYADLMSNFNKELVDTITLNILRIIAKLALFRAVTGKPDKNITRDVPLMVQTFIEDNFEAGLDDFEDWLENVEKNYGMPDKDEMLTSSLTHNLYTNKSKTTSVLKAYELSKIKNGTPIDLEHPFTIEHVMPQAFTKKWYIDQDKTSPVKYYGNMQKINTLGNLSLLTKPMNSSLGNDTFENKVNGNDKNPGFKGDTLLMNKEIAEFESWSSESIDIRSKKIVNSIYKWFN